jgi:hypothetical protein
MYKQFISVNKIPVFLMISLSVGMAGSLLAHHDLSTPDVVVQDKEIIIHLSENLSLSLLKEGNMVKGIHRLQIDDRQVLSPLAEGCAIPTMAIITGGEIEPVLNWADYLKERKEKCGNSGEYPLREGLEINRVPIAGEYSGWKMEENGVCITIRLANGVAEWIVLPARQQVYDGVYTGICWKLRLRDVGRVYEIMVEEPVAFDNGDWKLTQVWGEDFPKGSVDWKTLEEVRMGDPREHYLPERAYFTWQQPYFFLAGKRGSLVSYFGHVVHASVGEMKKWESDRIALRSRIPVRAGDLSETPYKYWLYREGDYTVKWDALNEWTWVYDFLAERYRGMKGVTTVEPKPTLFHQQPGLPSIEFGNPRELYLQTKQKPALEDSWLYAFAQQILPRAQKMGVRTVELRGILNATGDHDQSEYPEGSSTYPNMLSPWKLEISPAMGGEEGLRYVCDKAHDAGIKVLLWSTPAHLSTSSPLVQENPDWVAWRAKGEPARAYNNYTNLVGMSLRRGYFDYAVGQYRKLRQLTGFDGVWQDSYLTFGIITDFSEPAPYPQLDEAIELTKKLQEMGCTEIWMEGSGLFGLSSIGFGPDRIGGILGREYNRYYYLTDPIDNKFEPESHFRALASKSVIKIKDISQFEDLPEGARERISSANFAYMEVLPYMKRRRLIGSGDTWSGVEWFDEKGENRVLFSFEPMEWKVPEGVKILNVQGKKEFVSDNGIVKAAPWQIYIWR